MHLICLHNVVSGPLDALDRKCSRITAIEFDRFLDAVSNAFELVTFGAYVDLLKEGCRERDIVALSFDDGFLGVIENAKPALDARGLDAIAFINPPFLGNPPERIFHFLELEIAFRLSKADTLDVSFSKERFDLRETRSRVLAMKRIKKLLKTRPETERVAGHIEVLTRLDVSRTSILEHSKSDPKFRIMDPSHVAALRGAGWSVGSHAMSHRTLSMLPQAELEAEIRDARHYFENAFGWTDLAFAYPYGDVVHVGSAAPKVCAVAGHPMAFTTVPGPSDFRTLPHLLPRIEYGRFLREFGLQERVAPE